MPDFEIAETHAFSNDILNVQCNDGTFTPRPAKWEPSRGHFMSFFHLGF